jgi:hypothetical protein
MPATVPVLVLMMMLMFGTGSITSRISLEKTLHSFICRAVEPAVNLNPCLV